MKSMEWPWIRWNIYWPQPVLHNPDFSRPFILQTNASKQGIGPTLSQEDNGGLEHLVIFLSQKLLPHKGNYSTIELEYMAIVWAVHQVHHYLYGCSFIIQTDHLALNGCSETRVQIRDCSGRVWTYSLSHMWSSTERVPAMGMQMVLAGVVLFRG